MFSNTKLITKTRSGLVATVAGVLGITVLTATYLFTGLSGGVNVQALGVNPTVTPSTASVSTATTTTLTYTTSGAMTAGNTIAVSYSGSYTGSISTATVNTITATAAAATGTTVKTQVLTLGATTSIASGGTVTIVLNGLTTPATAGNYPFTVLSSVNNDSGANFQYVGQANVVQVRAFVPTTLSFSIRNTGDTADTNTCDLGTVTATAVATCSYRLKVATNAKSGYFLEATYSGNLTNSDNSYSITNAPVPYSGIPNVVAGAEGYGFTVSHNYLSYWDTYSTNVFNLGIDQPYNDTSVLVTHKLGVITQS